MQSSKRKKRNADKRVHYYRRQSCAARQKQSHQELDRYSYQQQKEVARRQLNALKEQVEDLVQDKFQLDTMVDGRFTDAIRSTAMKLHSYGVGTANAAACISTVGKDIFQTTLSPLPSEITMRRLVFEANILGKLHVHVGNSMLNNTNTTLHLDGTTDHQQHYIGFQASVPSENLSVAMVESALEDTATHVNLFTQVIEDYANILSKTETERDEIAERLIMSLWNTMTDQHVVNKMGRS